MLKANEMIRMRCEDHDPQLTKRVLCSLVVPTQGRKAISFQTTMKLVIYAYA